MFWAADQGGGVRDAQGEEESRAMPPGVSLDVHVAAVEPVVPQRARVGRKAKARLAMHECTAQS